MTLPAERHPRVLVIDDDRAHAQAAAEGLEAGGCDCTVAGNGEEGLELLSRASFDVVVTDLAMGAVSGVDVVRRAQAIDPQLRVIVLSGHGTVERVVEAMREGAYNFLQKPLNLHQLRKVVLNAVEARSLSQNVDDLHRQLDERFGLEGLIGSSEAMQRVFEVIRLVAPTSARVLITGPSGTGKEMVAKALHTGSPRKKKHFVGINCAALSEGILESELFGHEKGAFTGALTQRLGRFEYAHGGTLFLDEVGDMPMSTQIKLLRVIEEGTISRVGSNEAIPVDVRILSATNRDLAEAVAAGRFRPDLLFRLKVVTIDLPPLSRRGGDLDILIDHFLRRFARVHGKTLAGIAPEARAALGRHDWPGNVRELKNAIESMVVTARGERLEREDLPTSIQPRASGETGPSPRLAGMTMEQVEEILIRQTLELVHGNRESAAKMLGMGERTLYRKIKRYRIG